MSTSNSSIATQHNIVCKRGDTFLRQFIFWANAAKTIPADITGSTFKASIVGGCDDSQILLFDMANGFSITPDNILFMSKTADQMKITPGNYRYDLQQITGDTITTIMKGKFTIESDITV